MYINFYGEFQLCTWETHAIHIQKLRGPLQEHIATTYGIEYESVNLKW